MATLINLNDLLRHEILDLYSAEEQIIEALPKMIEKANNSNLKKALSDHLKVTEQQKNRLDRVKQLLAEPGSEDETGENKPGFFSRLFGGSNGEKCKGTEGLIDEGEKMMGEDMSPEALDAAIIASAQKIEHYEISGYGTARAFARELNMQEVAGLLTETLNEEYQADDQLTQLAVGRLNIEAERATGMEDNQGNGQRGGSRASSNGRSRSKSSSGSGSKSSGNKGASRSSSGSRSGSDGSKGSGNSSKSSGRAGSNSSGSRGGSSKSGSSKGGSSRGGSSKGSSSKGGSSSGRGSSSNRGSSSKSSSSRNSSSRGGSSKGSSSRGSKGGSKKSSSSRSSSTRSSSKRGSSKKSKASSRR